MIKTLKHLFLLLLIAIMAWACNNDKEDTALAEEEPVNLTISMKVPRIELSRGVSDDPRDENNTWNEWEELVDGRKLYHVTLFLIEKTTQRLVGIRDIEYGSKHITDATSEFGANGFSTGGIVDTNAKTGTEVTFTFKYDHPRHGACEKLRRGEFLMLAVANHTHRERTIDGKEYIYNGLNNGTNTLEELIESIKTTFDIQAGKGIDNFIQSNATYKSFFDFPVIASNGYLCDKNAPQALSLVKNIALTPGNNYVSAELKRTYSRIRIEVMNNSSSCPLKVHSLKFSDSFAQSRTYLFDSPDNPNRSFEDFKDQKGTLAINDEKAITSFTASEINTHSSQVVYDAYILESRNDEYTYTLDVEYEGTSGESSKEISSTPATKAEIEASCTNGIGNNTNYFMIKSTYTEEFLYDKEGKLCHATGEDDTFLWALLKYNNSTTQYYLYNKGTNHYVGFPGGYETQMVDIHNTYYELKDHKLGGYLLEAHNIEIPTSYTHLYSINTGDKNVGAWKDDNADERDNNYLFYKVTSSSTQSYRYNTPILLKTIDPITSQVTPVKNIQRNDFINVLVTVSFDEKNGDFNFVVKPWNEKDAEIEFN